MKTGIDICEVDRFVNKERNFFAGVFTENEITYAESFVCPEEHYAGFFSAKEAIMKAIGLGVDKIRTIDIEILHDKNKKPYAILKGNAKNLFGEMEENKIEISISHTKKIATAIAIFW